MRKHTLKIFNTESRSKEDVIPRDGQTIRMYTCGPTVYNFAHIGNFRTYVFEDLLRRTLKFFGYGIEQAMNLTDVDDKTIKGAIENQVELNAFTLPFKQAFFDDLKTLHIERVEHYPVATDYIPDMIALIQTLLDNGTAYYGEDGSVYFAIKKFPSYGRLSHLNLKELKAGASGVAADEYDKESAADFVLWKKYDAVRDGAIFWDSPFGQGRPGWHIECSAMAMKLLGKSLDIHVGGVDNCFPHHENEIAQSESCTHVRFARYWVHAEHLLVDHKKMSKSLGNFYTLRDLLERGYTGTQVRYMLLQGHYRTQLNFTFQGLDAACATLQRIGDFVARLAAIRQQKQNHGFVNSVLEKAMSDFVSSLADDLNISTALAAVFDMMREVNSLCDAEKIGIAEAEDVLDFLQKIDHVLAVFPLKVEEEEISEELLDALKRREMARGEKDWKMADECRLFIHAQGYFIEDTPQGARLKKLRKRSK